MSKRKAKLIGQSDDKRKAIYIDAENAQSIMAYLNDTPAALRKVQLIQSQLLKTGAPRITRDLYDKEDINGKCDNVYAMKPLKGKLNPRIYCQQYTHKDTKVFVIVMVELLEKKKTQQNSKEENQIINRVAQYDYELE